MRLTTARLPEPSARNRKPRDTCGRNAISSGWRNRGRCGRENGSRNCSIPERPSSNFRRLRRTWPMAASRRPRAAIIGIGIVFRTRGYDSRRRSDDQGRRLVSADGQKDRARARHRHREPVCRWCISAIPPADSCSCSRRFPRQATWPAGFFATIDPDKMGIKQLALVFGHCTAGGAYIPALSDYNVIVRGTGAVFLGGPPLVQAATGEDVTAEELGGGDMHTSVSGTCDYPAASEDEAIHIGREIVAQWDRPRKWDCQREAPEAPAYDPRGDLRHHTRRHQEAVRHARDHRAHGRRQPLPRIPAGLWRHAGLRICQYLGLQGRHPRQQRRVCSTTARSRARTSSSCATRTTRRSCSCRTSPAT